MSQPDYRRASAKSGLIFVVILASCLAQAGAFFLLSVSDWARRFPVVSVIVGSSVFPAVLVAGALWYRRAQQTRRAGEVAALERAGFRTVERPTEEQRREFFAPLAHLGATLDLQGGASKLKWFAVEGGGGSPARRVFEHEYTTGGGRTTQLFPHTVVAWPEGHAELLRRSSNLARAPWFMMVRLTRMQRRFRKDAELKLPEFATLSEDWFFRGDPATAKQFLAPSLERFVRRSPVGEEWSVGAGWICCSFKGILDAEGIVSFLDHSRQTLAAALSERRS